MNTRFLQIHSLTSYPAVLLNRDDAGFAKRIPFGGAVRTRISSQSLKRHWRTFTGEHSFAELESVPQSVRSRLSFEKYVLNPLLDEGVDKDKATTVIQALMSEVLGESKKAKKAKEEAKPEDVHTNQVTVLGRPELDYLRDLARKLYAEIDDEKDKVDSVVRSILGKEGKKNLHGIKMAAGLGAALFGRMVTSDILSRGDAAVHVAHAMTVHAEQSESDYFSAVDDLLAADGELGSGHINSVELNSGLYYGYVVIDLPLLVSNLEGCERKDWHNTDKTLAADIVNRLIKMIATVSPGAKLGSTAPYAYAHLLMVEAGSAQPRTLNNAFIKPVSIKGDLLANTYEALSAHLAELDQAYGQNTQRAYLAMGPSDKLQGLGNKTSLGDLGKWAAGRIVEA
jgi:CRISPR system Cascade subunit CasC